MLCHICLCVLALPTILWLASYFLTYIVVEMSSPVDIKKRYKAEWALVTGGGSGIGRSIVEKLAKQGLNVVLVSLPDNLLEETMAFLAQNFPAQQFRAVGAKFSDGNNYMPDIIKATSDINIQAVFNNAGYIVTGFFDTTPLNRQMDNMECNATAAARITHHFLARMIESKLTGCIVFTSSVSAFIPSPFSVMYGATKAFLSQFAASLAVEVKSHGIDVVAVHPSPVASRFYTGAGVKHDISLLNAAAKSAVAPDTLPDQIFRCIGRCTWYDIGSLALIVRSTTWFMSYNCISMVFAMLAPFLPDFKKHNATRSAK